METKAGDKSTWQFLLDTAIHTDDIVMLEELSQCEFVEVRCAVARNSHCSQDILRRLSVDISSDVRASVACNTNCPSDVFEKLVNDTDDGVALSALYNSSCPASVIEKVFTIHSRKLAEGDQFSRMFLALALMNPNCPQYILTIWATSPSVSARLGIALNTSAPPDLLRRLAKDSDRRVVEAVLNNPSSTEEICFIAREQLEMLSRSDETS